MLFFSLFAGFYHLGKGVIGEYDGNVICKIANSMPKISTSMIFFKGVVMMKTWISSIVMVLGVFLCVLLSWMPYNDFSMLYLKT